METNFKVDVPSFALGYSAGKKKGGGGMKGFHMVRFFNDDRTTLLYTVFVPDGANAIYAGETPVSVLDQDGFFYGFEPTTENVTQDIDCYACYASGFGTLAETSWEEISELSATGVAENFFAVGDKKPIAVKGTVGTVEFDTVLCAYILGFDHASSKTLKYKGITFGTFKTLEGVDITLCDNYVGNSSAVKNSYAMCHWGNSNYGGWAGCDLRYDVLGSTDTPPTGYGSAPTAERRGFDASAYCAKNPVPNTLMAALPAELRAVMKPMRTYTDNVGGKSNKEGDVSETIDYLPLLSDREVCGGLAQYSHSLEKHFTAQFDYFADGNPRKKFNQSNISTAVSWWTRSTDKNTTSFLQYSQYATLAGYGVGQNAYYSLGIAPMFLV